MKSYKVSERGERRVARMLDWFEKRRTFENHRAQPPNIGREAAVLFHNAESAQTIPSYGCFVADSVTCGNGFEVITAKRPSTSNLYTGKPFYLNGLIPRAYNEGGELQRPRSSRIFKAAYDTGTPAIGEVWGPKPSQWTLSKNYPGFRIVGIDNASAKIALVEPEPILTLHGKADSAISKGSSGTVSIWVGAGGSEVDSTINVTAYARGAAISSGKIVGIHFINGVAYVFPWEC